jgi:heptosyltransferase I
VSEPRQLQTDFDVALERVCIVMMSALGDAVHTLPVINAIKRQHRTAHITWVLQGAPAELVTGHRSVDEAVLFDRRKGLRAFLDVKRQLRARTFDLVLALQVYFKAGLVTALARAPVKLGFDRARARDLNWLFTTRRIPAHPIQHVQDQYFEFLRFLAVPIQPVEWDLGPWPHERAWQQRFFSQFDRPIAALVISTSKPEKDWLPERWAQLCDVLSDEFGLQPVLVGGNAERERRTEREIFARTRTRPHSALGSGIRPLVGILDRAAVVISPDTGPLHMSVALGTPVISLIGFTDPRRTGPYRAFEDLIVDAYHAPGENLPPTMETRSGRMARIQVKDVVQKLELWRARYERSARWSPSNR